MDPDSSGLVNRELPNFVDLKPLACKGNIDEVKYRRIPSLHPSPLRTFQEHSNIVHRSWRPGSRHGPKGISKSGRNSQFGSWVDAKGFIVGSSHCVAEIVMPARCLMLCEKALSLWG